MKKILCMMLGFVVVAQSGLAATPTATVGGIKWSYTVENGKAVIGGGFFTAISTATKGEVTIPSQIAGYTVVAINDYALSECVNLTGVIIPSGIETIGEFAFYGCSSLKKVVFPKSVKTIKQYAFYECPSIENVDVSDVGNWCGVNFGNASSNPLNSSGALYCNGALVTELVIPDGVKGITPNAFCGCTRIKRVDIPASVEEIGLGAFKGCNSIEWIRVPFVGNKRGLVGNTNFGHIFGASSYVRNKEAVPTSLKSIVVSDESIIAESAFEKCSGIESVIISKSVVSIGNGAFYGCSGILNIELPFVGSERGGGGDPNFGYVFGTQYDSSSDVVPSTLKTVKITDETSIANCAFQGCSNITKIEVSGNVNSIGNQAFSGCASLTEIDVSGNVKSIGYQAFSGCTSLTDVVLPNSLIGIDGKAFENCISLTTFHMPSSVVNIGSQIFAGCVNLTAVLVDGAGGTYSSVDGVLYSADQQELVFVPLDKTLFVVPATVKKIRAFAFANLTKLEQVVIPDGVEEIGADAFYGCTALMNIEFPNSLVSIGSEALKGCSSLKRVVLPFVGSNRGCSGSPRLVYIFGSSSAPTTLEEVVVTDDDAITGDAFSGCTKLKSVFIGSSVTNIGNKAFCDCRLIESLSLPFVGPNENSANSYLGYFFDEPSSKNRYVPTSLREVTLMSDRLPAHAFEGCTNIERVYLIGDLLEIGESAFEGCSSLINIQMPCGLLAIADNAFYNCSSLTKIDIPSTVERIGKCAFQGCTSVGPGIVCSSGWLLTVNGSLDPEVVIEEGVVHVLDAAFAGHTEIKSVVVPHSVVSIGLGAFKDCDQIETVTLPFVGGEDDSSNYWFGYIFGAESCDANSSYVPRSLRRVEISELVALDDYAFKGCAALDTIVAQSGLASLGAHTFDECSYLNVFLFGNAPSVEGNYFSNSLTRFKIEYGTDGWNVDLPGQWKGCQIEYMPETLPLQDGGPYRATVDGVEWLFYVSGGEVAIGGGSASETAIRQNVGGAVIVPAALGKCPVTSISAYAFYGCGSITSITVPESVKFIGECALQGCNALWSVTVPFVGEQRGVVGKTQFGYLFGLNYGSHNGQYVPQGLKNVAITDDIEIANGAFYECENISGIALPFVGDKRDGDYQFIGYLFCENINKNDMLVGYAHAPECNAHVPAALSTVEILGGDRIMNKAFYGCKNLTKVVLPEELVAIKDQAFYGCSNLRTINIPLFVREIGFDAFKECVSLGEGLITRGNWVLLVNGKCPDIVELEDGVLGIAGSAFEDCSNLKSIRLPDSLAYIGSFAFHYCTSLGHVDIPDNVSFIGSRAFGMCMALGGVKLPLKITEICDSLFSDCSNLLSVEIPDGVKSIGDYAFASCTRMTKITIPDSVESIGTCAFEACLSLSERVVNGWLLLGLDNPYIPSGTKGIAGGAFKDRNDLKNIVIPESVSYIGPCAFLGCISLTNAVIPYSVQRICSSTFKGCSSLRTIEMAEGVKEIESRAFGDCSSLQSVTVPRSMCSIGEGAFANCGGLDSIVLPFVGERRGADQYDWFGYIFGVDEWPCYYRDYSKTIPSCLKKVIITDDTAIGNYAFYNCKSIESVELSDNVETIGWWAFGDCSNLKDVVWSRGLKEIGDSSFYNTSLSSIILPIGFVKINESAFQSIRVPVSIAIPESVVEIGNSAFAYTTLTSVSTSRSDASRVRCLLKESGVDLTNVEFVDENLNPIVCSVSFESQGGTSVPKKSCKFGQAIGELDEPIFAGHKFLGWYTSSVGGVKIEPNTLVWDDVTYYAHWQVNQDELSVTFDANGGTGGVSLLVKYGSLALNVAPVVNRMGYAFEGWFTAADGGEQLLPATVVSRDVIYYAHWREITGGYEFGCQDEKDGVVITSFNIRGEASGHVVIPETIDGKKVIGIGRRAFYHCTGLKSVIIPPSVESVGECAFAYCDELESLTISEGVTKIENEAFIGCVGMVSAILPSGVVRIGDRAFKQCIGLEAVTIPEGVKSIGDEAFLDCSRIKSMTLPSSVVSVGSYAFKNCAGLESVTIAEGVASLGYEAFRNCRGIVSVALPSSITSLEDCVFEGCSGLSTIVLSEGLLSVGRFCFADCSGLVSVRIPTSVKNIGNEAFENCIGLESVVISEGLESIGTLSFYGCSKLKSVVIPSSVVSIGDYAFKKCIGLECLTILYGVERIGEESFRGCSGLKSIKIPLSVTSVGTDAFTGCSALENVTVPACITMLSETFKDAYKGIKKVVVLDGVAGIGNYMFKECEGLESVSIPSSVTSVGFEAFYGSGLTSVMIPSSVKSLGNEAFYRCAGLESVIISEGVTAIGKYAFYYCSKLESITIPSSVTKIGDYAFYDCPVLFVHVGSGETERVKGLYDWPSGVEFIEPAIPSVEGDSGATVTGDAETGFVIKPSAEKTAVEVTIPQGVDASKVTVEVSPKVVSIKLNGAKMKIVNGVDDITEFLDVPPANKDGVIDLVNAKVKEEFVKEAMDTEKGAVVKLDAANPTLTTPNTRKGLFYQLREGTTIGGMNNGDSILGDGKPWTPTIKVKGGASAFYTISVGK